MNKPTFWERHEAKFYTFGHFYANIYGQVMIDYMPHEPLKGPLKLLLLIYSHTFSLTLIVVVPLYFGYNYRLLMAAVDSRMQLVLYVGFANTLIKYITCVLTYMANTFHFKGINNGSTMKRAHLERDIVDSYRGPRWPKRRFEIFMYYKFTLINTMMIIQVCGIFASAGYVPDDDADAKASSRLRQQFAIYSFILWNYTEHMADYFFWVNSSVLKYLRLLQQQLQQVLRQVRHVQRTRHRGMFMVNCGRLCDRLALLRQRFIEIHQLYVESFRIHQLQLLGLTLTTLINNLTNFFTIFNLVSSHSLANASYPVLISAVYALTYYLDTYIVTLVNEQIKQEMENLSLVIGQFSGYPSLQPPSLDQELEQFSLQILQHKPPMLCGLLYLDRRIIYLIAVTAFSYFITLVQFDMYLANTQRHSR
ncbi:hypothetical protein KR215_011723 [Drosophila sulfurigaster]|nr:hypothetical protein KR215_011723 [Drosophila sulfurigaster]